MSNIMVDCSLIRHDGKVIGVSLLADAQSEAEYFCARMPKNLINQSADITIDGERITFINPGYGEVSYAIDAEDGVALNEILKGDIKLGIYDDSLMTPGFKIVPQGMEKVRGQKTELTRL